MDRTNWLAWWGSYYGRGGGCERVSLLRTLLLADTALPGAEEGRAVGKVSGRFPSCAVFGGASPLHQVGSRETTAPLRHNIVRSVLVGGVALCVSYREPTDGAFAGLHRAVPGSVFNKKRDVKDVMAEVRGRQLNAIGDRAYALEDRRRAVVAGVQHRAGGLMGKVLSADPDFVPYSKLNVTVSRIMVNFCAHLARRMWACARSQRRRKSLVMGGVRVGERVLTMAMGLWSPGSAQS